MKSQIDIFDEIIVDNFAGGGGASTVIELAAGSPVWECGMPAAGRGYGQSKSAGMAYRYHRKYGSVP